MRSSHLQLWKTIAPIFIMLGYLPTVCGNAGPPELVVNVGLQTGSFLFGKDVSMLNAHDYRPNEFVTSDVRHSTCPKPQTQDPHDTPMNPAR